MRWILTSELSQREEEVAQLRKRTGKFTVHRLELELEVVVEELVPVRAQGPEQLPLLLKPLEDELLLPVGSCFGSPRSIATERRR